MEGISLEKGSEFRKWDLHIHTPESFHNDFSFINKQEKEKYNNDIWKKYIDELERITDVPAIGITDYFSIDGYKKFSNINCRGDYRIFN